MQAQPRPQQRQHAEFTEQFGKPATSSESSASSENTAHRQIVASGRPKLVRRDHAVDLTAAKQQYAYTRLVQQAKAGKMLGIATSRDMENLISWLATGAVSKTLHIECDLGGPHCYEDPEYDDREVLDGQLFQRLLQACGGIRRLVLEECRLSQQSFRLLGTFLMREDCKLEALSLLDHEIDDKCAGYLAQGLRSNRSLREFYLGGALSRVSSTAMAKITDALASTPSINVLQLERIRDCVIWPSQLESMLASGSRVQLALSSPYAVRLYLQDYSDWNRTFADFCERLATDRALRSLDLSGCELTKTNIETLLAALQRNAHLERLELGRIKLTDEQQALISHCLDRNEANNQADRQVAEWQAAKALDSLVPALLAPGDVWPHELSQLLASMMDAGTLEETKKSGGTPVASGKPAKDKRNKSSRQ